VLTPSQIITSPPASPTCSAPAATGALYKIYAESFLGRRHLAQILAEATSIVQRVLTSAGARPSR
ncbi:MAG: hypothetical protein ACXVHJ_37465, partial [Solirubrobacteraceae bacterium]